MTKHDILASMATAAGITPTQASKAYDRLVAAVNTMLTDDLGMAHLSDIGTFHVRETAARKGTNPKTREPIDIPAGKRIAFTASKALKYAVAKGV